MTKTKILIVDDEKPTRDVMARILGREYSCLTAADAEQALELVKANPDLAAVLTDYKMPGMNGIELIQAAKRELPDLGAILITAFGEVELAVKAMQLGANDFLQKPITDLEALESHVAAVLPKRAAAPASRLPGSSTLRLASFTGESAAMQKVYDLIRRAAPSKATILIEGPSGTGKELVARAIHELSPRKDKPFVAVECSALSPTLIEAELFGYTPGSFTGGLKEGKIGKFEAAQGGTLFLDEIGELDEATQVKLLRTLEDRKITRVGGTEAIPVDFRLVTATNKNLAELVVAGKIREDFYYRINVIDIRTPALKDRPEDIPALAERFIKEYSEADGGRTKTISPEAMEKLRSYPWPGNVRQLRNCMERTAVLAPGDTITVEDLPAEITASTPQPLNSSTSQLPSGTLEETEKAQILAALEATHGNKSKAAEQLGISRRTLHRKLNEWGMK